MDSNFKGNFPKHKSWQTTEDQEWSEMIGKGKYKDKRNCVMANTIENVLGKAE